MAGRRSHGCRTRATADRAAAGKRWLAAPEGPIPLRLVSVVPMSFSRSCSSLSAAFLRWQMRSRSLISSAAECASVASVLRPCPVASTRVRADSLAGTSTTRSPSAISRIARCRPVPWQPPVAQCRTARSIARQPEASVPYRPAPRTLSSPAMTSIAADRLCGSIPTTTVPIAPSAQSAGDHGGEGGHRYFELRKPLLSLSLPTTAPGPRRPDESHTTSAGSRKESDEPGTRTEPGQAPAPSQQVADDSVYG